MRMSPNRTDLVLVINVGGTGSKVPATTQREERVTKDWEYGVASIGYPRPVIHGRPLHEPHNLGIGWVGFDFANAFGCPVKVINDAAMKTLGRYEGVADKNAFFGCVHLQEKMTTARSGSHEEAPTKKRRA